MLKPSPSPTPSRSPMIRVGRHSGGLLAVGAALVAAAIAVGARSIDLAVYLRAARALASGGDPSVTPAGELPWLYPPVAALPFVPLTWLPEQGAEVVMALASVAALARMLHLVLGRLPRPLAASASLTWACTAAAIVTEPVASTLGFGQINLVVGWLVTEGFLGRRRWLIGLAAGIKLTPLVFLVPVVLRRDWRGVLQVLGGSLGTVGLGWLVAPVASMSYWGGLFFDPRDKIGVAWATNQSLTGSAWRTFGEGGVPLLIAALSAAVLALTVLALRRRPDDAVFALWLTGIAGLLVSPISWIHHWVWTLPMVLWLWSSGRRRLALVWGVLLVGWVTWWLPGAENAWTLAALATIGMALRGVGECSGPRGKERHDSPQRAGHPLRVPEDADDLVAGGQGGGRTQAVAGGADRAA